MKKAYRASLLRFDGDGRALYDEDGLLVVAPDDQGRWRVVDAGAHADRQPARVAAVRLPGPLGAGRQRLHPRPR